MKKITPSLIGILLFLFTGSFAQAPADNETLDKMYSSYFELDREILYLHLNKTSLVPAEDLWISAYVYDPKLDLPNVRTLNLQVDIFSETGQFLDTQIVLISGGKGSATIALDQTKFPPGNYLLRGSTGYMENFEEDLSFVQPFTILGKEVTTPGVEREYDLQLLPEGGHLLANVINTIGVKVIDNSGKGVVYTEGALLDSEGKILTTFNSNEFGISKFSMVPQQGKSYSVRIKTSEGKEVTQRVPTSNSTGVSMTSSPRDNDFVFTVQTNGETLDQIKDKNFFLSVHKDGVRKTIDFQFEHDKLETHVSMSKDSLFPGVNTITIFNEDFQPVLERLIFNESGLKRASLSAALTSREGDSLTLELDSPANPQRTSLSVSVLPTGTKAYNPEHSILSAIHLKPYVRGTIENAAEYFTPGDEKRKLYDLDVLLLTQGWSKYDWSRIYKAAPKEIVERETGFTIEGKFLDHNEKREKSVFVRSEEYGLFDVADIQPDGSFKIENVYLEDSTQIAFMVPNERNSKVGKPKLSMQISPQKQPSLLDRPEQFFRNTVVRESVDIPSNFTSGKFELDTINLTGERKNTSKFRNERRTYGKEYAVTEQLANRFFYVTDFLETQGFRIVRKYGQVEIRSRSLSSILNPDMAPLIVWNGFPIDTADLLLNLQMSEVESLVINERGNGYGYQGGNGVIEINTRAGGGQMNRETILNVVTETGFSRNKEFYTPKYTSYNSEEFREYGAIGWEPNLTLSPEGNTSFKIANTLQPEVQLFVEGINAEGVLFSEILTVQTR